MRPAERWSFAGNEIVAAANWPLGMRRKLVAPPAIQIRTMQDADGIVFEFASGGLSLDLGPFANQELAHRFANLVHPQAGHWVR